MFRRYCALALLILVVLNLAGFHVYFILRLQQIHEESRSALSKLPDSDLERFEFTADKFKKIREGNREFLFNGRMYDIARMEVSSGTVKVWALHDEAEDDLLAFIGEVIENAVKDDQPVPASLTRFLSLDFLFHEEESELTLGGVPVTHRSKWIAGSPQEFLATLYRPPAI